MGLVGVRAEMHTVLLEETSCCAAEWLLLPGAGQSVVQAATGAQSLCTGSSLGLPGPLHSCEQVLPRGTMLLLETYAPMCSFPSSLCCNLQGAELTAGLDQLEGALKSHMQEPRTPSMVTSMLDDMRVIRQLLQGDAGRASRVLQLVARHASTGSAAARKANQPEPAGPSTSQRQLLGLLDSILIMMLASSVPSRRDGQEDTGALSVVLLTAALERLHSHHRTDALRAAEHFPAHLDTNPRAKHTLKQVDMEASRSQRPAKKDQHAEVDTYGMPRAL